MLVELVENTRCGVSPTPKPMCVIVDTPFSQWVSEKVAVIGTSENVPDCSGPQFPTGGRGSVSGRPCE